MEGIVYKGAGVCCLDGILHNWGSWWEQIWGKLGLKRTDVIDPITRAGGLLDFVFNDGAYRNSLMRDIGVAVIDHKVSLLPLI